MQRSRSVALLIAFGFATVGCAAGPVPPATDRASDPPLIRDGPTGRTERGMVVRVVDGDTIRVRIDGIEERVRYIGIDTPESVDPRKTIQPYALAASEANTELVGGREVVLEKDVSERDRYDRLLRYIWLDDPRGWVLVNHELVMRGFASAVTYPPDVRYEVLFRAAERAAREAGIGLWGFQEGDP